MTDKQLYIETYGCQMNVNDSERILTMLAEIGYQQCSELLKADLILLNTCSVRGGAEEKIYRRLENLGAVKRKAGRQVLIGVGGCVAQQEGEALQRKFPWLDLVFGTHNLHQLPDLVQRAQQGERRCETAFIDNADRLDLFPAVQGTRQSSFVTVMQGCDNYCSYCIVPYVRGREVSRRSSEILREIIQLAASGVQEIILLGQNVNSYGLTSDSEPSFAGLLQMVAEVEGIRRIRFVTSHPKDMSDELIHSFATIPKLCGQIHLPAQAGSNAVLARMNRGYTRELYLEKVAALKAVRPGIAITGDMIVGFPGETDEDFQQTLSLMEAVRYMDLFSFSYSPRPGTAAAGFSDDLTRKQKQERLEQLQALQKRITREISETCRGTIQSVLVEGVAKRAGQVTGKADNGRTVNFAGDENLVGRFVDVRITQVLSNCLLGEQLCS